MKRILILILVLVLAAFTLSACNKGVDASVKEVSIADIKDDKLKEMIELLNDKNGAHIYMAEKDFYLFLNASNTAPGSKAVEFGGVTVSVDDKTNTLIIDYVEREIESKENIKNKVLYKIPVPKKPDRLRLLKNGQETPVSTIAS